VTGLKHLYAIAGHQTVSIELQMIRYNDLSKI